MRKTTPRSVWESIQGFDRIKREYIRLDGDAWLAAHRMDRFPDCEFGFHVNGKRDWAQANVMAALDAGVTMVEGSICSIGGGIAFPGDYGSVGNMPTEDIVSFLDAMGVDCGVGTGETVRAARDVAGMTGIALASRAGNMPELA